MHRPVFRVMFWVGIASFSLFVIAASSPQCSSTSDDVLNPALSPQQGSSDCKKGCVDTKNAGFLTEKARFRQAKIDCNGDQSCLDEQIAINQAIKAELVADKDACQADCDHEQGTAVGGQ